MKKGLLLFIMVLSVQFFAKAQDASFEKWAAARQKNFDEYKAREDVRFANFLKNRWLTVNAITAARADTLTKLPEAPVVSAIQNMDIKLTPVNIPNEVVAIQPVIKPKADPILFKAAGKSFVSTQVPFYALNFPFIIPQSAISFVEGPVTSNAISNAWLACAESGLDTIAQQWLKTVNEQSLNDWAAYLLLKSIINELSLSLNDKAIATWYILVTNKYNVKVGFTANQVFLLMPSRQSWFGIPFVRIPGEQGRWYALDAPTANLRFQSYTRNYPGAVKSFVFTPQMNRRLVNTYNERVMHFNSFGREYQVGLLIAPQWTDYLNAFPQTGLGTYFSQINDSVIALQLRKAFVPYLKQLEPVEKVTFLLNFVQTGFEYTTDDAQFGKEKYLFPFQTLALAGADCEDRSALFAYLIRVLLGYPTLALDYPGHVACAVAIPGTLPSQQLQGFKFKNRFYAFADPTYINAPAGLPMPQFAKSTPNIIEID